VSGSAAPSPVNFHACAVALRGQGVLIAGGSGSGKTRLALTLLREARRDGREAAFVADDQVMLSQDGAGGLIARAPAAISGLVEIRGFGPVAIEAVPFCSVRLLVRLVAPERAPRMAQDLRERVAGVDLPRLDLAQRDCAGAALAVNAFFFGTVI
jgi:HPr kinase/phosphorylase